ncbi:MAG TPA: alpha/beta hydrolase [Ktedonobacteraceae bacterium]
MTSSSYTTIQQAYGPAEQQQFGILYLPQETTTSNPLPIVVLIHGGFWRNLYGLSLMEKLSEDLVQRGYAVWNIEYRRVGEEGGGWPGTLQDVGSALDYLTTLATHYPLDLQRVITVGSSAGGHLSLWSAARQRIPADNILAAKNPLKLRGAISLAGAVDLKHTWQLQSGKNAAGEFMGGDPTTYPERYAVASPAALLPLGVPQVLVHGTADDVVPLIVSQDYVAKAKAAGDNVTLIEVPGADHNLIDPAAPNWTEMTVKEIERLLA